MPFKVNKQVKERYIKVTLLLLHFIATIRPPLNIIIQSMLLYYYFPSSFLSTYSFVPILTFFLQLKLLPVKLYYIILTKNGIRGIKTELMSRHRLSSSCIDCTQKFSDSFQRTKSNALNHLITQIMFLEITTYS